MLSRIDQFNPYTKGLNVCVCACVQIGDTRNERHDKANASVKQKERQQQHHQIKRVNWANDETHVSMAIL